MWPTLQRKIEMFNKCQESVCRPRFGAKEKLQVFVLCCVALKETHKPPDVSSRVWVPENHGGGGTTVGLFWCVQELTVRTWNLCWCCFYKSMIMNAKEKVIYWSFIDACEVRGQILIQGHCREAQTIQGIMLWPCRPPPCCGFTWYVWTLIRSFIRLDFPEWSGSSSLTFTEARSSDTRKSGSKQTEQFHSLIRWVLGLPPDFWELFSGNIFLREIYLISKMNCVKSCANQYFY